MKRLPSLPFLAALVCSSTTAAAEEAINHGEALTAWIKEQNGYMHPSVSIHANSGMFATKDIEAGETLLKIPRTMLITAEGTEDTCDTARNLAREMKLGNDSKWAPFINYLNDQPVGQLPSAWSQEGKDLLNAIVGYELPPVDPPMTGLSLEQECGGDDSDLHAHNAYMLVLQRGWDDLLIPYYDMLNHRNGKWLNTEIHESVHSDNEIVIVASKHIPKDAEIYGTYDMCFDCGNRKESYGTPEMLRDYGFVEQYPQRWIFPFEDNPNVAFSLDQDSAGKLHLTWLLPLKEAEFTIWVFRAHLERIEQVAAEQLESAKETVPPQEYETIVQYYEALTTAMKSAIETAEAIHDDDIEDYEQSCTINSDGTQTCTATASRHYDALEREGNHLDYTTYQCYEGR